MIKLKYLHMKQIKKIGLLLGCLISLVWMYGCSSEPDHVTDPIVTISADKTSIKANGKDKVVFTVTVDKNDISSPVVITQKDKNTSIEGMSFSTDSAATYTFYATYNNFKSNEISVDALDLEVIMRANKQTIKANNTDIVTFSVEVDNEDVTSSAQIIQVESDSLLTEFHTNIPGDYTFYATYNGKKSSEIHIDASAITVSLSVDKTSIKANNRDKASFTVKVDGENVTSSAVIMQRIVKQNYIKLDNNEFFSDVPDSYAFYADYEGVKSNEVVVESTYVELAFLRSWNIVQIASTIDSLSPLLTVELEKLKKSFPGKIHVISLHPYGQYCMSELSGALAQTANNFVEKVNRTKVPFSIVDLFTPVALYQRDTQIHLVRALDKVTLTRDRLSMTGMAVQSTMNGNKIDFVVKFKTLTTDTYRFFAFVVEDGVVKMQKMSDGTRNPNYIHNNVATYQLTEGDPFLGVNLGKITAGYETPHNFSINTDLFDTDRKVNFDNCRIVCYTLRSKDGVDYFVDNVTTCPVNGSVRFLYEQ